MKKIIVACFAALLLVFGGVSSAQADEYLRVGMEAAYAPFNWTQDDNSNGAIPALTSGKIDMIIAGMSPTAERRQEIDFSDSYYRSEPVIVVSSDGNYAKAKSVKDFKNAKITAQQGVYLYNLIDQIPNVNKQTAMGDFGAMRQALASGIIDGYVSERPEARTAEKASSKYKMISLKDGGFQVSDDDVSLAVGLRKGDNQQMEQVNKVLAGISQEKRVKLMDHIIDIQPADKTDEAKKGNFFSQVTTIIAKNWPQFLRGTAMTLLISIIGTVVGTFIGLMIGVYRTAPKAANKFVALLQKIFGWFLNVYIEVFRGTPMIVQSMVIYYGTAQAFGINIDRTLAAIFIVSINTGAYMSEIVRGGIFAVDKGQFEAATALGFTHGQTMRKIVLPQVIRNILPATGNEFVINIKDTSVLNVISVVELYFAGNTVATQTYQYFQTFFVIAAIYFVLTFTVTRILRYVERRLDQDTYTQGGGVH